MMDTPLILRYQWNWECLFRKLTWTENLLLSFSAKLFNVFNNTFGDMSHPCSCFWVPTLSVTEICVCASMCIYSKPFFLRIYVFFTLSISGYPLCISISIISTYSNVSLPWSGLISIWYNSSLPACLPWVYQSTHLRCTLFWHVSKFGVLSKKTYFPWQLCIWWLNMLAMKLEEWKL